MKQLTKKQRRRQKVIKLLLFLLILVFIAILSLLVYFAFYVKKPLFISPLSSIGFEKNTKLEKVLSEKRIEYKSLKYENDFYRIILKDGGEVFISENKDLTSQISSLQLILKRLKIEGKRFKNLDFRYDNPVIVF